jgi:hypothetical protein
VIATAWPRIEATLQRPLGDMAIVQQRAPGSDLAPPGRPLACRHPPDRCRHRLVVGVFELLQHCSGPSSLSALMRFRSTGTGPKYRFAPKKRAFRP